MKKVEDIKIILQIFFSDKIQIFRKNCCNYGYWKKNSDEALFKLPTTHLFTSEIDILFDDQRLFYEAASEAGANIKWTVWKGAAHCEQSFSTKAIGKTIAPSIDENVEEMIDAIANLLK